MLKAEWHNIETAPKDRYIIAWANEHGGNMCIVRWSETHQYWLDDHGTAYEWDYWTETPEKPVASPNSGLG